MLCSGVGPGAGLGGSRSPSSPCPTSFDSQMETESGVKLKTTRTHAHTTRGRGWKSPGVPEEIGSTKAKKSRGAERWNQRGVVAALVPVVPAALGVPSPPWGHRGGATAPLCPGWAVLAVAGAGGTCVSCCVRPGPAASVSTCCAFAPSQDFSPPRLSRPKGKTLPQ